MSDTLDYDQAAALLAHVLYEAAFTNHRGVITMPGGNLVAVYANGFPPNLSGAEDERTRLCGALEDQGLAVLGNARAGDEEVTWCMLASCDPEYDGVPAAQMVEAIWLKTASDMVSQGIIPRGEFTNIGGPHTMTNQ